MILLLCLLAAPAAQTADKDFYALGRNQAQFVRAMADHGFGELAEHFCTQAEAVPGHSPAETAALKSVHLDLDVELAKDIADPLQRKEKLAGIVKDKEAFIAAYPDTDEAKASEANLPEIYRLLGEAYTAALKKTTVPEEITKLRSEGSAVFRVMEDTLSKRLKTLDAAGHDTSLSDADSAKVTQQHMLTAFNLGRTYYFHSLLLAAEDPLRETFLKHCIDQFQEFTLDYADNLLNFEGMIFTGLAHRALGSNDDALQDFDDAIALRDQLGVGADGKPEFSKDTADVIASAVLQKMLLLIDLKRQPDALSTCDDFLKTIPDAVDATSEGLAILAAKMQAELESGGTAAASATAQTLVDKDPHGSWGARGKDVLGSLLAGGGASSLDQKHVLKVAESLIAKKDYEQAIKLCNQAAGALRASGQKGDDLTETYILTAISYHFLGQIDKAALAYDVAAESNPTGARAPDALYYASTEYRTLFKSQKKAFYDKRAEDRMAQLVARFPKHPKAAENQLTQAQKLEENDQFAEAADRFVAIAPDSPVYQKAQFNAGVCLYQEALRLSKAKKFDDAKAAAAKAEPQLRKAQQLLDTAADKTLDLDQKSSFETLAYQARATVGELLMLDGVGREKDALPVSQEIEDKYAGDDDKVGAARSLRVRALTALGKVDEAKSFLESLVAKDPDSKPTAAAAGVLARTLDKQASDAFEKDKKAREVGDLWKQAFRYYNLSMAPKLGDPAAARSGEIAKVADRLFIMALYFNGVPDNLDGSFVGWSGHKNPAPEYFEKAASLYEISVASSAEYHARVGLARAYGFLGQFKEAADLYSKIIDDEAFIDTSANSISKAALANKPELMNTYLEYGVALLEVGRKDSDTGELQNAGVIFDRIVATAAKASQPWWQAKYNQVAGWVDQGDYKKAMIAIRDLARNTQDFDDGKYGLNEQFKKLQADLVKKGF